MRRVALLVEHGADVNTPGLRDGRTPDEAALREGHTAVAEYLCARMARTRFHSIARDAFALACWRATAPRPCAAAPEIRR